MSIYNSQSPFNQGAKRSEITAANKQRRKSRRQRVKKGRNTQYPEKRYSKKNPPNKGISGADMMSMQFHGYTDVPDSDERKSPMNQKEKLQVPLPKPKLKQRKSVGKRIVKQKVFSKKLQVPRQKN